MRKAKFISRLALIGFACLLAALPQLGVAATTNSLVWKKDRVTADVRDWELSGMLEKVAKQTGWQVFVEPGVDHKASAKFKNYNSGEALRALLGDLNFALVPQTNSASVLFVFRTEMANATRRIVAKNDKPGSGPRHVANQLIVRFKSGADAERWAQLVGAKIIGRITNLNAYLLQFDDEDAMESARNQLAGNSSVENVDYNYFIDQPEDVKGAAGPNAGPINLQLKPPTDSGRIIVGLVDTAVQSLGPDLDKFLLKQISVTGSSLTDPNSPSHGTSMAETILRSLEAATHGSTSVQILPVDVYGMGESANTWNVAAGIIQAVNNGANVINLSLGGTGDSSVLRDIVKEVSARGILLIGAAGNEPVTTAFYPAAYHPGVLAVTAGSRDGTIASYANRGSFVDLVAPGTSVVNYGGQQWLVQGTSAAAAYTTGTAAGVAETQKLGWNGVRTVILNTFPAPKK